MIVRNIRAHNINVRFFILRSATGREDRNEVGKYIYIYKKKKTITQIYTKGQQAINHVSAPFLYARNEYSGTRIEYMCMVVSLLALYIETDPERLKARAR